MKVIGTFEFALIKLEIATAKLVVIKSIVDYVQIKDLRLLGGARGDIESAINYLTLLVSDAPVAEKRGPLIPPDLVQKIITWESSYEQFDVIARKKARISKAQILPLFDLLYENQNSALTGLRQILKRPPEHWNAIEKIDGGVDSAKCFSLVTCLLTKNPNYKPQLFRITNSLRFIAKKNGGKLWEIDLDLPESVHSESFVFLASDYVPPEKTSVKFAIEAHNIIRAGNRIQNESTDWIISGSIIVQDISLEGFKNFDSVKKSSEYADAESEIKFYGERFSGGHICNLVGFSDYICEKANIKGRWGESVDIKVPPQTVTFHFYAESCLTDIDEHFRMTDKQNDKIYYPILQ